MRHTFPKTEIDRRASDLLDQITAAFKEVLAENLIGIYVHGSIAFGCFSWQKSDIDFIVVVGSRLTHFQKLKLLKTLLELSPSAPIKGLEMSVVLADVCRNFIHPTPYELHFSNEWLEKAGTNPDSMCGDEPKTDPDLAAHFTVIHEVGITWYGLPVDHVFSPAPREDYLDSLERDLMWASEEPIADPVYLVLNLCRVEAFKREGLVLSKVQGAEWALAHLPGELRPIVSIALANYQTDQNILLDSDWVSVIVSHLSKIA